MRIRFKNTGSALVVTVFAVAMLAVLTIGILQINTEELQIARNQICTSEALATAEAGLNDAFVQFRTDPNWTSGFSNKAFLSDFYTVTISGTFPNFTIISTATTLQGFITRMSADVTIGALEPYVVRVDKLRINE